MIQLMSRVNWLWATLILVTIIFCPHKAAAQFQVVAPFSFPPNGHDNGKDGDVNDYLAGQAIEGFVRKNAIDGILGLQYVNRTYFLPISYLEPQIPSAQRSSDALRARTIANQLLELWTKLENAKDVPRIQMFLTYGKQAELLGSFSSYAQQIAKSVQDAQAVPGQIEAFIKSNEAGVKLLEAAWHFQGTAYKKGMQCNDLVAKSLAQMGFTIPVYPWCPCTVTGGWFKYGMGPLFRQIIGGDQGVPLSQLAMDYASGKVNIPIGSVILADGHAALFEGLAKINGRDELITYDANDASGWTVSVLSGTSTHAAGNKDDLGVVQLVFGGHQVGEHATRLQWKDSTPVKIFQFIGNSLIPDPLAALRNARNQQCLQDVELSHQLVKELCSANKPKAQCDEAEARYNATLLQCSVPASSSSFP